MRQTCESCVLSVAIKLDEIKPVPGIQIVERGGKMVASKLNCTPGKRGKKRGGASKGTPVNILKKGSFRYTGFQYTLLLVDYDTLC